MNFSVRKKLITVFTSAVALLVVLVSAVIGFQIKKSSISGFYKDTARNMQFIERGIHIFFNNTTNVLTMLSKHPYCRSADSSLHNYTLDTKNIKASDTAKSETEKNLVTLFKQVHGNFSEYVEVYMGTQWGGYATSFDGEMSAGYDPRTRSWYTAASENIGNRIITDAYLSTVGDIVVCLSHSVLSYQNEHIGNVSIELTLNTLTDMIGNFKMGNTGYAMLVQNDGTILADPKHPEFNFKKMNEVGIADFIRLAQSDGGSTSAIIANQKYLVEIHPVAGVNWKLFAFMQEKKPLPITTIS